MIKFKCCECGKEALLKHSNVIEYKEMTYHLGCTLIKIFREAKLEKGR